MTREGSERLLIHEVGLRDGLQNEPVQVATADKLRLLHGLVGAGLRSFEATSFVSARAVPQLADAAQVIESARAEGGDVRLDALVINPRGYDRALAAGAAGVAIVVVVTEELCQRNNRMSVAESVATACRLVAASRRDGLRSRVYLAPAWVCPFSGPVDPDHVLACGEDVFADAPDALVLADTIGHAHPLEVADLFERFGLRFGIARLAAHFHDTQALGLANAAAAIAAGVRTLDASIGGLGGCPFAPGAAGNLATEDLALMAAKMGFDTGIDLGALWSVVDLASSIVGRALGGRTRSFWQARTTEHAA